MISGIAWDVWPRDVNAGRIAMGHKGDEAAARAAVEHELATNEDACFGVGTRPDRAAEVGRRGRSPGSFAWHPLREWPGGTPAEPGGQSRLVS